MSEDLLTRREAAELSGVDETVVKKAVDQRVIPTCLVGSRSLVEVADVPVLALFGQLLRFRLSVEDKHLVRDWLRSDDAPPELELGPNVVFRAFGPVAEARERAERYARLRQRWIVSDPEIKGGEPVIAGSRVSAHTLAERIADEESDAAVDEDFPHIPAEAREVAVLYARANPRRGRPKRSPPAA